MQKVCPRMNKQSQLPCQLCRVNRQKIDQFDHLRREARLPKEQKSGNSSESDFQGAAVSQKVVVGAVFEDRAMLYTYLSRSTQKRDIVTSD